MRQGIKERHVMIDWSDVKHKFLRVVAEGKPWKGINEHHHTVRKMVEAGQGDLDGPKKCKHRCQVVEFKSRHCEHLRSKYERKYNEQTKEYEYITIEPCAYCVWAAERHWDGGSYGQTCHYVRDGFRAPEFEHSAEYVPLGQKKRPSWSAEPDGDMEMSRLYGGYDDYFLVPADVEKKPGIRVMIEFAFACGVANSTIEQYGAWVAGLLGALEQTGYDMEVDMWIPLDSLFVGGGSGMRDNVLVRVKRQNEVSDFTEWSALFAPTGYRHLGFCAKLVAGDKLNLRCSSGLGTTLGGQGWGLEYEPEDSILKIRVDQRGSGMYGGDAFPVTKLNAQAVELGLIPEAVH